MIEGILERLKGDGWEPLLIGAGFGFLVGLGAGYFFGGGGALVAAFGLAFVLTGYVEFGIGFAIGAATGAVLGMYISGKWWYW